jgi:hypothetical protein
MFEVGFIGGTEGVMACGGGVVLSSFRQGAETAGGSSLVEQRELARLLRESAGLFYSWTQFETIVRSTYVSSLYKWPASVVDPFVGLSWLRASCLQISSACSQQTSEVCNACSGHCLHACRWGHAIALVIYLAVVHALCFITMIFTAGRERR